MKTLDELNLKYGIQPSVVDEQDTTTPVYRDNTQFDDMFESDTREGEKLKKQDLYRRDRLNKIRNYMIGKKGAAYRTAEAETVVEDFVDSMRRFNTNIVATAGEARYISKADDETKKAAKEAYELYDSLGNVFVNDGVFGAVDGVKDYILAVATDPTNYLGLVTGFAGKAGALGVSEASKAAIKNSVAAAARRAAQSGATKEAAKKAGDEAAEAMIKKLTGSGYTKASMTKAADSAAKAARAKVRFEAGRRAARRATIEGGEVTLTKGRLKPRTIKFGMQQAGKKAVLQTTAIDSLLAGYQDMAIQDLYLDVGAQEKYSALQTGLSLALGGVAGGLHYTFGKAEGLSGFAEAADMARAGARGEEFPLKKFKAAKEELKKLKQSGADKATIKKQQRLVNKLQSQAIGKPLLAKKSIDKAATEMKDAIKSWGEKVRSGKEELAKGEGNQIMPESLLSQIMLGYTTADKAASKGPMPIGGLAKIFNENGIKFSKKTKVSDVMTNLLQYMPEEELKEISKLFKQETSIDLGTTATLAVDLGDIIAATTSGAGSTLSVMAAVRRATDAGVVSGNEILATALEQKEVRDTLEKEGFGTVKRAKGLGYAQNVWKRLLVSSPATTAANVAGFAQFYGGQGVADIFASGQLYVAGIGAASVGNKELSQELFRKSRVYRNIQTQKMKNFLDPLATYETFISLMDDIGDNKEFKGLLFETIGGGVERTAKRYNVDVNNPVIKNAEIFADASMTITGVRIQDTFTKSQMFMTELDKFVRLKHDKDLIDVLKSGDLTMLDDDVIGGAVDTTLRSVFSKDYTTDDQYLGAVARAVEQASNTPVLGTVIPFGRFMNNVVATAYQWSPLSFAGVASRIAKKEPGIKTNEAFARSLVGTSALIMAMQMDNERQKKGLGVNEIEMSGTVMDVRNVFPFSLFLVAGRVGNLAVKGETVPPELIEELGNQLAIGQVARDLQFGNDVFNAIDFFSSGGRGADLDALYKSMGNIAAGATRPLDAINRSIGFLADNDVAKDVRQADGFLPVFTQSSTKYFDNILEALIGESETLTGKNLRVSSREGDIYDANPLARILGLNIKRGKTATEQAYTLANLQSWKQDQRSNIPTYDRLFNAGLAPMLEKRMQVLLSSKRFQDGDLEYKRGRVKYELKKARDQLRDYFDIPGSSAYLDQQRYRASTKGTKAQQSKAMKYMKSLGVDAELKDFNFRELKTYESYIDHLNLKIKTGM